MVARTTLTFGNWQYSGRSYIQSQGGNCLLVIWPMTVHLTRSHKRTKDVITRCNFKTQRYLFTFCHCMPLIIQDYCSWTYDKTYETQSFVGHGNYDDPRIKCHTRAARSCDIFNLGSSYFHVTLTTMRHLLNVARTTELHMFCRVANH